MVTIILGTGFEEAEALVPCDLLRRAGIQVQLAGIGGLEITGGHGITVKADCIAEETDLNASELVMLPGGLGGVKSILDCPKILEGVAAQYRMGKRVAAICAAPTVLARLGITDGKKATCYPGCEEQMGQAQMVDEPVITDGMVTTGRAAGAAVDFGLELIALLKDRQTAHKVSAAIVYR